MMAFICCSAMSGLLLKVSTVAGMIRRFRDHGNRRWYASRVRAVGFAAVGIFASIGWPIGARAEPAFEASGFVGVDRFGPHTELGNSFAPEQVPGTSALVGGRFTWIALPALAAHLQLGVEAEAAFAPATTGQDARDGRMSYFAPVFEWGAHALLRWARPGGLEPHLVVGGGAQSITSSSPFIAKETDGVVTWGLGVSMPLASVWRLRLDGRQDIMAARGSGLTSGFALQLGVSMAFGGGSAPARSGVIEGEAVAAVTPRAPVEPVVVAPQKVEPPPPPDPDPDHDGILGDADKCPTEPETRNGFEDDDGCPDSVPADVTTALATVVKFEAKRARVTPAAAKALKPVIAMLEAHGKLRISIVGHGDADLAKRRAEAIKWYLVDQGVTEDRVVTSVGEMGKQAITFALVVENQGA
jgi:outer membrane protein OmpA-like peptidoglycan-associated protein